MIFKTSFGRSVTGRVMEWIFYILARGLIKVIEALPFRVILKIGRIGGTLAYYIDRRHRKVAIENLAMVFGKELSFDEIVRIAKGNFKRIGENFASSVKAMVISDEELSQYLEVSGLGNLDKHNKSKSIIMAIGHFGNFELYARANIFLPGYQFATTFRGLNQPLLDNLLRKLRAKSGCLYFDRRMESEELKKLISSKRLMLGFLVDQNAGQGGIECNFLGVSCSTSRAPAVFALRYKCPLHTAICYRVGPEKWRIEIGPEIQTIKNGAPRSVFEITSDINQEFEKAVRADPTNWFWVHRRWKKVDLRTNIRAGQMI